MGALNILAADTQNASVAGQTQSAADVAASTHTSPSSEAVGYAAPVTLNPGFSFDSIIAGGWHPENWVPDLINTDLAQATDSVAGRIGGLVPAIGSVLQPGPAGGANAAAQVLGWPGQLWKKVTGG